MIDVNDLDGLLELANDYVDDGLPFLTEPVSYGDLVILVERIISAEKDAARYRWLRNEASMTDMQDFSFSLTSERDAFMDDAMQCSGDNK